jgi:chromosome segregation ATPase
MSIQAGKENERKWEEYWSGLRAQGKYLPVKVSGEVNVAQVGRDSKIGRENLYKNPNIHPKLLTAIEETQSAQREVVNDAPEPHAPMQVNRGREEITQKQLEVRDRRIRELEEKLAVLTAENHELRQQIKALEDAGSRYEFIENMVAETGRRIRPH